MIRKLCQTNKEALRWCQNRRAKIQFIDIADPKSGDKSTKCKVYLDNKFTIDNTLIKGVNKWITHFNKVMK